MKKRVFTVAIGVVMALAILIVPSTGAQSIYAASPSLIKSVKAELIPVATIKNNKVVQVKVTATSKEPKKTTLQGAATLQVYQVGKGWKNLKTVTSKPIKGGPLVISFKYSLPKSKKMMQTKYRVQGKVKATKGNQTQIVTVYSKTLSY